MSKERNAILTQNSEKSKAPIIIAVVVVLALGIAAYFLWLRPSGDAEAGDSDGGKQSDRSSSYSTYDECLMKTHSATNCAKQFYNK